MSISKAILNAGERMRPLLKKCIPQSMLSRIKAGVLNREAENIGSVLVNFCNLSSTFDLFFVFLLRVCGVLTQLPSSRVPLPSLF